MEMLRAVGYVRNDAKNTVCFNEGTLAKPIGKMLSGYKEIESNSGILSRRLQRRQIAFELAE
jgi:hypothetical protein